jgi:Ser/Thr protein kinase RdoA (MazF antagonist)
VGVWLRGFQDATHGAPVHYNRDSYLADLEKRLLQGQEKGFEPGLIQQILQKVSLRSAPLNRRLISAAAKHGDFIPQNILIEDGRVGVVDFEGFGEHEAVYEDLGMFLGYIFVLGGRTLYSRQSLDTVRRGFLAGFLTGDAIDQALLDIYILKGAVRVIADGPPLTGNWGHFSLCNLNKRLTDLASDGAM